MLSPPKQIPVQCLLFWMINSLTQPATTFFVSQMKKTCLKQPLETSLSSEEIQNKHKEQCLQNKRLSDYI